MVVSQVYLDFFTGYFLVPNIYLTQMCSLTIVSPNYFNFFFCVFMLSIWYAIRFIFPVLFSFRVCFSYPFWYVK